MAEPKKVDPLEQLGAEARELEKDTGAETREQQGAAEGAAGAPGAQEASEGAAGGAQEAEVIPNPAPMIAAALRYLRDLPLINPYVPAAVTAVFSDKQIEQLADAAGAIMVKYHMGAPTFLDRWKEEVALVVAVASVGLQVHAAMHGDDEAARAARARDVSPGAPGAQMDPPNPAAGKTPVEPGG